MSLINVSVMITAFKSIYSMTNLTSTSVGYDEGQYYIQNSGNYREKHGFGEQTTFVLNLDITTKELV